MSRHNTTERTAAQVMVSSSPDGELHRSQSAGSYCWPRKVRKMRADPTIAFLRDMFRAPIMAADWTVTCEDGGYEDAEDYVYENTVPFRMKLLEDAIRGLLDFGWQPFEVVKELGPDGKLRVQKYKALLQDLTVILVDEYGRLMGLRNEPGSITVGYDSSRVDLRYGECACLYREAEGTYWYGEPRMSRLELPYDAWNESDSSARRFDKKMAGAHWVLWYPPGTSKVEGVETDNFLIAKQVLDALESSGRMALPQEALPQVGDVKDLESARSGWRLELLSAQTNQSSFVDRGRYLDSLKARGMGLPERSVLEGQFGTRAEAEAHADFAIDSIETEHKMLVELLNHQVVDSLLALNYGPRYVGKVKLVATPLSDAKRAFLRSLFTGWLGTEDGKAEMADRIDWDAIQDELGVPVRSDEDAEAHEQERLAKQAERQPLLLGGEDGAGSPAQPGEGEETGRVSAQTPLTGPESASAGTGELEELRPPGLA